jgi:DNA-binding MarR family transcriptional regulator
MGDTLEGRTASRMPSLDFAEQRSWQNYLDSALGVYAALNRSLVDAHQLTLNDVRLLDVLERAPNCSARMGDLADELMSLPSRVTRQLNRLEAHNLARRHSSPEDGRGVVACITDEGRELLAAAMVTYAQGVRAHFLKKLSRAQVASLGESCRRVGVGLKADAAPARLGRV